MAEQEQSCSLINIVKKEFKEIFRNRILIFNAFFLMILVLFICLVYQKGVLDRMDIVMVDLDQTSTSRLVTSQFADNEKFQVDYAADYSSALEAIKNGKAVAGVVIPPGLAETVKNKQGGEVLLLVDGTNYIVANSAYAKANEILLSLNVGIALKTLSGLGYLPPEGERLVQPIKLEQKILYNPGYNYAFYLSYGLCGAGIFSLAMSAFALSLCQSIINERTMSFKELAAKTIAFTLFICPLINLLYVMVKVIFGLPWQGAFLMFFFLTVGYSLLIAAFGISLLAIARKEERIFQLGVFFATTLFFTTGYTWPLQSIPEIMKPIYWINPLTPFLNGVRACLVMGADGGVMGRYILWQLALAGFYLLVSFLLYGGRYEKLSKVGKKLET